MSNNRLAGGCSKWGAVLAVLLLLTGLYGSRGAQAAEASPERLLPLVGGALVEAGERHWPRTNEELELFDTEWKALQAPGSDLAGQVASALTAAKTALAEAEIKPDAAYQAVSQLAKATGDYVAAYEKQQHPDAGKQAAASLLPMLKQISAEIGQNQWTKANADYKQFVNHWFKVEAAIRSDNTSVYGSIETKVSLTRIALQAEPPRAEAAKNGVADLIKLVDDYAQGKSVQAQASGGGQSVAGALALLQNIQRELRDGSVSTATDDLQSFIGLWPAVEGSVQTRSPETYTRIETLMTQSASLLLSEPPRTAEAESLLIEMEQALAPYTANAAYSASDAALILLREGVEALLVLTALLAFVHRTGNASKQKWIWSGAVAGLVVSGALALVLTLAFASAEAGSTREMLEGVTGLVSVVLMFTVGAWLHSKSQTESWNRFIRDKIGIALASGNLWSLFYIAALSILREGAETTIFYIGMAPSIEPLQLLLGIGAAALLLIVLGVLLVKGIVRLPVRPFFLTATLLIYYLVVKFLGESIHSLQVAGRVPAHVPGYLPTFPGLGVYPTWETLAPQLLVLLFIVIQLVRFERKRKAGTTGLESRPA